MLLFQPSTVEIHGFTDEGIARLFAVFISETVATFPLGRGEVHASGFEILIVITRVVFTSFFLKFVKVPQADIQNCVATPWFFGGIRLFTLQIGTRQT